LSKCYIKKFMILYQHSDCTTKGKCFLIEKKEEKKMMMALTG